MWQGAGMSNPQDPYGQQPADYSQQQYAAQGYQYPQQQYQGYVAPKKPFDLAKVVTIAGWVVAGLYSLSFLYTLTQDDQYGPDFGDRLFGAMPGLGQGLFFSGALLAIGVWLLKQQEST
jgi:uncharacterized membrane protein